MRFGADPILASDKPFLTPLEYVLGRPGSLNHGRVPQTKKLEQQWLKFDLKTLVNNQLLYFPRNISKLYLLSL